MRSNWGDSREQRADSRQQGAENCVRSAKLLTANRYLLSAFCFLLSAFSSLSAQEKELPLVRTTAGSFTMFSADNLGNLYAVTQDNQLKKYNVRGDSMGVFNDVRRYGKLSYVNTTNPLRTLLFYRDFRTVIILDRLLNTVNTIDLRKLHVFQVRAVAPAYDNNIWVFDEQESKLKKVGEDGRLLSETADLRLVLDEAPLPVKMYDQNGYVYMYDPTKGVFIFDYYGALKNKVALLDWNDVQVLGDVVVGRAGGKIMSYKPGSLDLRETVLPSSINSSPFIQVQPQGIYVLTDKGISLYSFTGY